MLVGVTLLLLASAAEIPDAVHLRACVSSVRSFVSDDNPGVDWLLEKANQDLDTVVLYLLRMCYFHHQRVVDAYSMQPVFDSTKSTVSGFSEYEFQLLAEIVKEEASEGSEYRLDESIKLEAPSGAWEITAVVLAVGIPLALFRRRSVINHTR